MMERFGYNFFKQNATFSSDFSSKYTTFSSDFSRKTQLFQATLLLVLKSEDGLSGYHPCLFLGKLAAPPHSTGDVSTFALVAKLHVAGGLLAMLFPMMPSFRTDVVAKIAVHEKCMTIVTPRTTEIYFADTVSCRQSAVVEDIAVGLISRCRRSSDV
jgi:hypothetical protein